MSDLTKIKQHDWRESKRGEQREKQQGLEREMKETKRETVRLRGGGGKRVTVAVTIREGTRQRT